MGIDGFQVHIPLFTQDCLFFWMFEFFHCSVREYHVESKLASLNRQLSKKWPVYHQDAVLLNSFSKNSPKTDGFTETALATAGICACVRDIVYESFIIWRFIFYLYFFFLSFTFLFLSIFIFFSFLLQK
jgi:hypothetical protein